MLGDTIVIKPAAFFMFHYPAIEVKRKGYKYYVMPGEECKQLKHKTDRGQDAYKKCMDDTEQYNAVTKEIFYKVLHKYLTHKELLDIFSGYNVYISGQEMQKRINMMKETN
jgi:hypothetical protein